MIHAPESAGAAMRSLLASSGSATANTKGNSRSRVPNANSSALKLVLMALVVAPLLACSSAKSRAMVDAGIDIGDSHTEPDETTDAGTQSPVADAGNPEEPDDAGLPDAGPDPEPDCAVGDHPTDLRCTGLYEDFATQKVADDVQPYDPGLHLWSDGAEKTRWVYLPPGGVIDTSDMDEWVFPIGTKFWKQFALNGKKVETRLLWKREDGNWYRTTYRWSADESTAIELIQGEVVDANGFEIPSQSQCAVCHRGRRDNVLGFDAVSLSAPLASGLTMNELATRGLVSAAPASPIVIPGDATAVAALGYLHANCGTSCHNRNDGEAVVTGFYTRLDVATLATVEMTDTYTTGMGRRSYYPIPGVSPAYVLAPCDPAASVAYYRMSHRDDVDGIVMGTQMPRIGTHLVDEQAVVAIAAWLDSQPQCL